VIVRGSVIVSIGSSTAHYPGTYAPVVGHSLSWTNEKRRIQQVSSGTGVGPHTMFAKIWTPEDPRHAGCTSTASSAVLDADPVG